ncbi:MAG: fibronectin type III domain-containing protein [Treponema sp.]|jgi:hypothetical protein|nr:fibronectin type III domain-containing protein [Treponema sp.]
MMKKKSFVLMTMLALAVLGCPSPSDPPAAPEAPAMPAVTPGVLSLEVSWDAVTGAAAYEVWYGTGPDSAGASQFGGDTSETSVSISGLESGTTYYVWVKAKNSAGTSAFSPAASGVPQSGASSSPPERAAIADVSIDLAAPVAPRALDTDIGTVTGTAGTSITWYDSPTGGSIAAGSAAYGTTYRAAVVLTADPNHHFSGLTAANVTAANADADYDTSPFTDGKKVTLSESGTVATIELVFPKTVPGGEAGLNIIFSIEDDPLAGFPAETPTIYRSGDDATDNKKTLTVTLTGTYASYAWYVDGTALADTDNSVTIDAEDYAARTHTLTVIVSKDGVFYSKEFRFIVRN